MNADETFEKFHGTWPATDDPDYQAYATERDAYKCGWSDARAGMVPEGELAEAKAIQRGEPWGEPKELSFCSRCAGADPHCYICGCRLTIETLRAELAKLEAITQLKDEYKEALYNAEHINSVLRAELAKAWEAGASAALAECPHGQPNCSTCRDRIRALQPPGGKAK